ncbi:MAG TPA: PAS domain S-box protein [bacterium]
MALLLQERQQEKGVLLDKAVAVLSKSVASLTYDYTCWDEMLEFIHCPDSTWAEENLVTAMTTFSVNALWLYNTNLDIVYSASGKEDSVTLALPVPIEDLQRILTKVPFSHFYARTPAGLMELCTAPCQPSADVTRVSPAQGYFIVGRLWSPEYVREISLLTSSHISLTSPKAPGAAPTLDRRNSYGVLSSKPLLSLKGDTVMWVSAYAEYPAMHESQAMAWQMSAASLLFALLMTGSIAFFLLRFVSTPLNQISAALESANLDHLRKLRGDRTEFGRISALITSFFEQRDSLTLEMAQRRQADEKAETSLSLLQATLESTTDGLLVVDMQGRIRSYNQRFLELWRIPLGMAECGEDERLLKYAVAQLRDPDEFRKRVQELYSHPEEESLEIIEFEDGRYYERNSRPQVMGGVAVGRVWSFRDVTERMRAEMTLRESESRFRTLADSAPVLVWMAGLNRHYHYFNRTWLAFTGRTYQQEYGRGWLDGVHPDDRQKCENVYQAAFTSRRPFSTEFRLKHNDGTYHWVLDMGTPRFAAGGEFTGFIGSSTDVTDQIQARDGKRITSMNGPEIPVAAQKSAEDASKNIARQLD